MTTVRYGTFDDAAGCYRLERTPPRKWNNIHYNQPGTHEVYAEFSNIGDGPVTVRDADGRTWRSKPNGDHQILCV